MDRRAIRMLLITLLVILLAAWVEPGFALPPGSGLKGGPGMGPGGPGIGPGGPGAPGGPGGPGGPDPATINHALDICYSHCVGQVQVCLRPSLASGYGGNAARTLVASCTDAQKKCMLACPK